MNRFIPYNDLQFIEPEMIVPIMEKINQDISDNTSIPDKIEAMNLIRSIRKSHFSYFIEIFNAVKPYFISNCLNNSDPLLKKYSLKFLIEIFDDDSYEISNEMIYGLYENVLRFLNSSDNEINNLAQITIKTIAENVVCEAKIIVLIETLKDSDENLTNFIYECFKAALNHLRGFIHLNYDFNSIFDKLCIEDASEVYYGRLRKIFSLLITNLETQDEAEIRSSLKSEYRKIYNNLIS